MVSGGWRSKTSQYGRVLGGTPALSSRSLGVALHLSPQGKGGSAGSGGAFVDLRQWNLLNSLGVTLPIQEEIEKCARNRFLGRLVTWYTGGVCHT